MIEINVGDQVFDSETQSYAIVACRDFLTPIGTPFDWGIRLLDEENNQSTMIIGRDDKYLHRTNKFGVNMGKLFKVVCYIPAEGDLEDYHLYKSEEEAQSEVDHCTTMQPENIYKIEELSDEEYDQLARKEVEQSLHQAGIIEDPDIDGGLLG